ncbi:LruC domain-containing protein [Vibrio chagasii]|nr:LruC domain-containing protein [Vibrio chagasii]
MMKRSPDFAEWATSGGSSKPTWYLNPNKQTKLGLLKINQGFMETIKTNAK